MAMGKMSLFCTARHGLRPVRVNDFSPRSFIRNFPRNIYSIRWALAGAAFSLMVAMLLATSYRQMQSQFAAPSSHAARIEASASPQ